MVRVGPPLYVQACEEGRWVLRLLRKSKRSTEDVRYRCRAWRHDGPCRRARANKDGRRIRAGMEAHGGPFAYLVLTTDPVDYGYRRGAPGEPPPEAWTDLHHAWTVLWKAIRRRWAVRERYRGPFGRMRTRTVTDGAEDYCSVVEETRAGWPHLNVIIAGGPFVAAVQGEGWHQVRQDLNPIVTACGFGERLWVEPVAKVEAISLYISKLAGEASKASQVPVDAPRGFRRLRATRGFLPKVEKDPDLTGLLVDITTGCAVNQKAADAYYRILDILEGRPVLSLEVVLANARARAAEARRRGSTMVRYASLPPRGPPAVAVA